MTTAREKLTAYLQLARLSNLPTVFSNVLVGVALASGPAPFPWGATLLALFTASLLYTGGMALNDVFDRRLDAVERPDRPIPSGALSVREAVTFTALCFAIPLAAVAVFSPGAVGFVLALAAAIVLYDALHKRWSGSLVFMGLCRALVYALAAAMAARAADRPPDIGAVVLFGSLLALYIIGLTTVAQKEVKGGLGFRRGLASLMVLLPFSALLVAAPLSPAWTLATGAILFAWLSRSARYARLRPPKIVPAVLGWLAGIALLDAFFLTFTPRPMLALAAWACFAATVWGHRRIPGT